MKHCRSILSVLTVLFLSCSAERNDVVISGQFLGEHPEELWYTLPVNGNSFEGFVKSEKPDSSGRFSIRVNVDEPALIDFLYLGSPSLIIEPGSNYEISLSLNTDNILEIGGNPGEAQKLYSGFSHQHPMSCLYSYGEEFTNYHSIRQKLNDDLSNEISALNELHQISGDVLNLLVTDRKIYYYTAQSVLASRNHLDRVSDNKGVPDDIFSIWSEAAYGVPMDSRHILNSPYSWDYLQMYLWYRIYTYFDFDEFRKMRAERRADRTIHAHNIELAREFLPDNVIEFFIAGSFYHQYMRREYDNGLLNIFEQFKLDFPESKYLTFVERTVEEMIENQ